MWDTVTLVFACIWSVWSSAVVLVQGLGVYQIFRHCSSPPPPAAVESLPDEDVPIVTVIRPVKGLEPALYACLASTFQQTYPRSRLHVHLCVESRDDPSMPVLQQVLADFPDVDARIYVEAEDPLLHGPDGHVHNLGPNPKIRNVSRAYREARGDLVWIVDCNVWLSRGVAGRMVDKLCGYRTGRDGRTSPTAKPYKFVHQLPLVVDITEPSSSSSVLSTGGSRLDEMFMATSHAKFYSAINTVGIAPCIVGKSNMFRKSHLDAVTDPVQNPTVLRPADALRGRGIDFFSSYICEDHLIGDLLWRSPLPGFQNHGLVAGDLAIQPMADTSVRAYAARRARWLRVRKFTVLLATLVEPGVESLLCCFYGAFALTTVGPTSIPRSWATLGQFWLFGVLVWMAVDWCAFRRLHACRSVEADEHTPPFARSDTSTITKTRSRPFWSAWLPAWLGRELLALPIWTWAVLLGTTVAWRGKHFRVKTDMSVVELDDQGRPVDNAMTRSSSGSSSKDRID